MIWARMDGRGKFGYTFVEGTIRKEEYREQLKKALLLYTRCLRRDMRSITCATRFGMSTRADMSQK